MEMAGEENRGALPRLPPPPSKDSTPPRKKGRENKRLLLFALVLYCHFTPVSDWTLEFILEEHGNERTASVFDQRPVRFRGRCFSKGEGSI
ncbi:hypothetical protein CDAR_40481 [Caerostris darwini]|uniref:Uncharacterized protein n=1 Tax=Caerostris darwini TaxID=1538125 RepID=A0AAV4RC84_9ARAC|nr:hypothetical protein CDAR_40481 [Caerostris darwini]